MTQQATRTINEAIQELKSNRKTVYSLINSGLLKTYKLGRRRYTTDRAIQDCIIALQKKTASGR